MNVEKAGVRTLIVNVKKLVFDNVVGDIVTLEDRIIVELHAGDFPEGDPEAGRNNFAYG